MSRLDAPPKSPPSGPKAADPGPRALSHGLWRCHCCGQLSNLSGADAALHPEAEPHCSTCGSVIEPRKAHSLNRSWAYLLAAMALYIPANLLPVTTAASLLGAQSDTIFSGIVYLWQEGSWALALIVFVASILVPMGKLLVLSYLLLSVHRRSRRGLLQRLRMYRVLEMVGRWSMLDVFVVTMLAGLIQIQSLAQLNAGPGAMAFGTVVVLTMLATHSFDPRLMFDAAAEPDRPAPPLCSSASAERRNDSQPPT